ncbi:MAG TPA: protein kinase, partial [Myxococcales bacterium]|nr:protein kinase [Myxococcales bacterium]
MASTQSTSPNVRTTDLIVSQDSETLQTIQDALEQAPLGSRILVRPGLYRECLVLDKDIELIADGPCEEVIIESPKGSCLQMKTEHAHVQGFTLRSDKDASRFSFTVAIQQGQLLLEDCDITSTHLACIATRGSQTTPTIRRCKIHGSKD